MHLIHQHHIDISCFDTPFAHQFKGEVGGFFRNVLYPKLEQLLDRYDAAERVWNIEHLPVNITAISRKNWKQELLNNTLFQIEEFLKKQFKTVSSKGNTFLNDKETGIPKQKALQELLLFYLKKGSLPANVLIEKLDELFKIVDVDAGFFKEILLEATRNFSVILRWSLNVPEGIKLRFCTAAGLKFPSKEIRQLSKGNEEVFTKTTGNGDLYGYAEFLFWVSAFYKDSILPEETLLVEKLAAYASNYYQIEPHSLLQHISGWEEAAAKQKYSALLNVISHLKKGVPYKTGEKVLEPREKENQKKNDLEAILAAVHGTNTARSAQADKQFWYINNVGLVILHPFLVPLFQKLGYLQESEWKSVSHQHRAVLLLQYLVSGSANCFENELVLNRVLCGVDLGDTIKVKWEITKEEKEQCQKLLDSVIEHWTVLKKTSVKTLQEVFLQRKGKLAESTTNTFNLRVEQQSIDLLLDHLPWGIATIKTPWMRTILTTYWL